MSKHRQKKSSSEKLEIIHYSKKNSVLAAAREFGVSATIIYKWKELYDTEGESGLSGTSTADHLKQELKRIQRENDALKKIVAEKELRLRIQEEMLKKSH